MASANFKPWEEATQDDGPDTEEMEVEVDFIMAEDVNDGLQ